MGDLTARLSQYLESELGERYSLGAEVRKVPNDGNDADDANVILTVPADVASNLLWGIGAQDAVEPLDRIQYAPLITATVFTELPRKPKLGVGVLFPECENRKTLGILFNSYAFEGRTNPHLDRKLASFTFMFGGTSQPDALRLSDSQIHRAIEEDLAEVLEIRTRPELIRITRWPRAIPLYSPGLVQTWKALSSGWASQPGRMLFGNYTGQVSLRGMIEDAAKTFVKS
jgi:oxygen-dependent protoporphyrinogen oxidase